MNKKMRELAEKIKEKKAMAESFLKSYEEKREKQDLERAKELIKEAKELDEEFKAVKDAYELEKSLVTNGESKAVPPVKDKTVEEHEKFAKAIRSFISNKGLVEGTGADGGYTVPEDISTRIEKYPEVEYSLLNDIEVVPVTTNKGARTYQEKGKPNVFVDIDENGEITEEITAPKFKRVPWAIQDRAGFMPVSNDLVDDSDANILSIVEEWLMKANVATSNKKILELIALKPQTDLKNLDGIKKALNVTLGQAYKNGAKIYTNDDGLNYLDTLKDKNDRPLLNADPTAPQNLQLRCGVNVLSVKVIPNSDLPTNENKVPFIVGNLFDYGRKYNRKSITIMASNIASIGSFNAFAQNMTLLRAIMRDDYRVKDENSIVNGFITVTV